jgi:molybdopterin molybdotransferase
MKDVMGMLAVDEAQERILDLCTPLSEETVSVEESVGRAMVRPLQATRMLPPWDEATVDGYAVRTEDLTSGPVPLTIIDRVSAGQKPALPLQECTCTLVSTGAELPFGADAVVPHEFVQVLDEERVEILHVPKLHFNVRRKGEDIREGQVLLKPGSSVGLPAAAALWSQGIARVMVRRRPQVAICTTGDELCNAWEEPHGRIVDTNSPVMAQAVKRAGGIPTTLGVVPERIDAIVGSIRRGLEADVLVTMSRGDRDVVRSAFDELGIVMDAWSVAMSPGGALAVGRGERTLVFDLPRNSTAAMIAFELFVRPALKALQGLSPLSAPISGRCSKPITKPAGVRHYIRAAVDGSEGGALRVTPLAHHPSIAFSSAGGTTHLINLDPEITDVEAGSEIKLISVDWEF